jgi:hypothetical protein
LTRLDTLKETRPGSSVELIAKASYFYLLTANVASSPDNEPPMKKASSASSAEP